MYRKIGLLCRKKRLARGWSLPEMATALGYQNINKGCRRINSTEYSEGRINKVLLQKTITLLEINHTDIEQCRLQYESETKADFQKWQSTPAPNQLFYRAMSCVYVKAEIPDEIKSTTDVIQYACVFSLERKVIVWLYLGKKERIIIKNGTITSRKDFSWQNFREPDFMTWIK